MDRFNQTKEGPTLKLTPSKFGTCQTRVCLRWLPGAHFETVIFEWLWNPLHTTTLVCIHKSTMKDQQNNQIGDRRTSHWGLQKCMYYKDHVVIPLDHVVGFNIFTHNVGESGASYWCAYVISGTIHQPHHMFSNRRASSETNYVKFTFIKVVK